jgi:hypothetical protein
VLLLYYDPLSLNSMLMLLHHGKTSQSLILLLNYIMNLHFKSWYILKISHKGDRIQAFIDGDMKLMVNSGEHITQPGGVGLWTKADAATSFDNFTVVPY